MFNFNQISEDSIQIYGEINGHASLREVNGVKSWKFDIKFSKGSTFFKVASNEKDGTIWNIDKLKERILKTYYIT